MNGKCVFIGTSNRIPEYLLGSSKKIKGEVETDRKGSRVVEDIKSPSWKIGRGESKIVKDYNISISSGKVQALSQEDFRQNPVTFKCWNNPSEQEFVQCSGNSSSGNKLTAVGSFRVKRSKAIYKEFIVNAPIIGGLKIDTDYFWHFTIRLRGKIELVSQSSINGTIGILNLVKAKRTAKNKTVTILDSNDKFILHTYRKDGKSPILNLQKVTNGAISNEGQKINSKEYQINFPLNQVLKTENQSYSFDDTIRSYFFFKGQKPDDIWYPIGFENSSATSPSCIEWKIKAEVAYSDQKWKFLKYEKTNPRLVIVTDLPEWEKNIWS